MSKILAILVVALCAQKFAFAQIDCDHLKSFDRKVIEGGSVEMTYKITHGEEAREILKSASVDVGPHSNLTVGNCSSPGSDMVYFHQCVLNSNGVLTLEHTFRVEQNPDFENTVYHCIRFIDEVLNDEGGTVTIEDGGIGFDFVVFNVQSQDGKGVDFEVELYSRSW